MRLGDALPQLVLSNINVGLKRVNLMACNPLSTLYCASFLGNVPSTFLSNINKVSMALIPGANALYQKNDPCTIASLTSAYWQYSSAKNMIVSAWAIIAMIAMI
jgi:hypothetical protein